MVYDETMTLHREALLSRTTIASQAAAKDIDTAPALPESADSLAEEDQTVQLVQLHRHQPDREDQHKLTHLSSFGSSVPSRRNRASASTPRVFT
jgi:hypothetical protein